MLLSARSLCLRMSSLLPCRIHPGLSWQQSRYVSHGPAYSESLGDYQVRRLRRWTAEEIEIIDLCVKDGRSWRDLIELLPARTPRSIRNQWEYQRYAAMPHQTSSNPDVQAVLDLASKGVTRDEIQAEFSHLPRYIINQRLLSRGIKLGPTKKTTKKDWLPSEDDVVKQGIKNGQSVAELEKHLPGRTTHSISVRMYRLAFTAHDVAPARQPWTEQDDAMLLSEFASGKLGRDVAKAIGRSYNATHNRLQTLRLRQRREADRNDKKA